MTAKLAKQIDWKKRAWSLMSEFVRRRDNGKCYTCSTQKPWFEMQAGHYIPGSISPPALFFDFRNVHCQCVACNLYKSGNLSVYAVRLEAQYGSGILQELDTLKKSRSKWSITDYQQLIHTLKRELLALDGRDICQMEADK
jgi:hypothetical protein